MPPNSGHLLPPTLWNNYALRCVFGLECAFIRLRSFAVPHDLKIAVRHLLKSPRNSSIMAVLMLALGIGATTAIFSIVEGVLLRPLPFPHSDQLVVLSDTIQGAQIGGNDEAGVTGPDIVNYARDTHSFSALGGYTFGAYELSGIGDPAQVIGSRMTPGVFAALAVEPLLGRVYTPEEDAQHRQVALLSYATWQSRYHGEPQHRRPKNPPRSQALHRDRRDAAQLRVPPRPRPSQSQRALDPHEPAPRGTRRRRPGQLELGRWWAASSPE